MNSPRTLIFGGCALAFGAAFTNTGLVIVTGTSVSHLTGDIAAFTINIARWSPALIADVISVSTAAVCFLLGATLSGFVVHHPTIDFSRPYGRGITGIGLLLIGASYAVMSSPAIGIGLAAFACGFQNALATHYRGLVLRTTHLTGMFTDFGVNLGMKLRGHETPTWKIVVPALLIGSFCAGGIAATLAIAMHHDAIRLAGIAYCLAGITWSINKHTTTHSH